jgi:hypothetical protein
VLLNSLALIVDSEKFPLHFAIVLDGRAITKSRAIHKSHEPIYETNTINKAKILKSTTIDIVKLEE